MNRFTLVVVLAIAAPAAAQSRVYTNADLGKPIAWGAPPTAEQLESLARYQYHAWSRTEWDGPDVTFVTSHDPYWPFAGPPAPIAAGPQLEIYSPYGFGSPMRFHGYGFGSVYGGSHPYAAAGLARGDLRANRSDRTTIAPPVVPARTPRPVSTGGAMASGVRPRP